MLKTLMTEQRLKKLFLETEKSTNNFTDLSPKVLMKNSNRLIVFRLALGLSQESFAKLLNIHFDSISQHERIKNKKMAALTANKFVKIIKEELESRQLLGNVTSEKILETFNKFKKALKGGFTSIKNIETIQKINSLPLSVRRKWMFKGWVNSLSKRGLSPMEKRVFLRLKRSKIDVRPRFLVKNREFDLSIFKNNELSMLIEVVDTSVDPFKIFEIRKEIEQPIVCILRRKRRRFFPALSIIFDKVLFEDELDSLIDMIRKEKPLLKDNSNIKITSIGVSPKMNDSERAVLNSLNGVSKEILPQVKFNLDIDGINFQKIVDFVFPNILQNKEPQIFIEIKNRTDPLLAVLDASLESILLKRLFPFSKFFFLLMLKEGSENWRLNRILSEDMSKVGIDKICFNVDELKKEIASESASR